MEGANESSIRSDSEKSGACLQEGNIAYVVYSLCVYVVYSLCVYVLPTLKGQ